MVLQIPEPEKEKGIMKHCLKHIAILLLFAVCLASCTAKNVPQSGAWLCEELQIVLDFDVPGNSKIETDNTTIFLSIENDKNSNSMILSGKHPESGQLTQLFVFDCVGLTQSEFTVCLFYSALPAVASEGTEYRFSLLSNGQ